ncbi:MAG: DNA polymerase III subunit delta' [Gammaproteobacteria bacterium]|jgi:DNA polymerase-3 subunit delta'|nr:DNA polymerase III subunit delta' [Gammaproteobacteria bacterium]MBT3858846.1 DNA polymerase III subunit delta' [Gammaproteobacteria bacterium]MBT3986197.1 DNA polymerase III subunit delta' [Gammaproteobacteria bacterium]MBT4256716.1 DNA polymerase III subunit delta' [Gammaproteobacteria bacterium]MBT4581363.1 DNA polymerase III subunit delta' [Gammaproteobacteria bacterium]
MTELNEAGDEFEELPYPWQEPLWQDLSAAFTKQRLAHSLLITGVSGLGKTDFLTAFSRLMICASPSGTRACGSCVNCLQGGRDFHPDILDISIEEGSKEIKVDQIRALSEFAHKTSHSGSCKVVLIQDAHRLNISAANALLKTLEEPSPNTFIFLVSDLPGRLLPTIRSRCQTIKFPTANREQAEAWLEGRLSESDKEDLVELLEASFNRPLYALSLAEEGELKSLSEFLRILYKLKAGSATLHSVTGLATKIGCGKTLHYLSLFSTALIKKLIGSETEAESEETSDSRNSAITELCSRVNCTQSTLKLALRELLVFDQELNKARRQLTSTTNPNPQLLLESILWQWDKLPLVVE